jgi:predicted MPP superfamily phosphohydrolase
MSVTGQSLLAIALCLLALVGHLALWVGVFGRMHALGLRRRTVDVLNFLLLLPLLGVPAVALVWLIHPPPDSSWTEIARSSGRIYLWTCAGMGILVGIDWSQRRFRRPPAQFLQCQHTVVDVAQHLAELPCAGLWTRTWARVPGNEILQLEVNEKTLVVPRLSPALDGLTIAHFSDLHWCGNLTPPFFEFAVAQVNAWDPDLVAITGDLMDDEVCLPWIGAILGRVVSRCGTFCVRGNHDRDLRVDALILRHLTDAGLQPLGGQTHRLQVRGQSLLLAGNECPWFGPAPALCGDSAAERDPGELRILLSHSPDQIEWARAHDFDLMLAGHTHGGQIRLPLIGPIVANSLYGVKYAGGVFYVRPTLLHVSRGLSEREPFRWNCRPELSRLVLRCGDHARTG